MQISSRPMEWKPLVILAKVVQIVSSKSKIAVQSKETIMDYGSNDSDNYGPQISLLWNKEFFIDLRDLSTKFENVLLQKILEYKDFETLNQKRQIMHTLKFSESISGVTFTTESLSIRFLDTSSMLSQKDRQLKLAFRKAQQIQLLLFSHGPTTLLAKVKSNFRLNHFFITNSLSFLWIHWITEFLVNILNNVGTKMWSFSSIYQNENDVWM